MGLNFRGGEYLRIWFGIPLIFTHNGIVLSECWVKSIHIVNPSINHQHTIIKHLGSITCYILSSSKNKKLEFWFLMFQLSTQWWYPLNLTFATKWLLLPWNIDFCKSRVLYKRKLIVPDRFIIYLHKRLLVHFRLLDSDLHLHYLSAIWNKIKLNLKTMREKLWWRVI